MFNTLIFDLYNEDSVREYVESDAFRNELPYSWNQKPDRNIAVDGTVSNDEWVFWLKGRKECRFVLFIKGEFIAFNAYTIAKFIFRVYTLDRCEFERQYVPCGDNISEVQADLSICQHESTVAPTNTELNVNRNNDTSNNTHFYV